MYHFCARAARCFDQLLEEKVGPGTGPVLMSGLRCSYVDETPFQCDSLWKNASSSCKTHSKDAAVSCFKESRSTAFAP